MSENRLPEAWNVRKLGEICHTTSGGTPSRRNSSYYNGTIPWVKSGELDKGIILDTEEKISEEAIKNSSAKIFPKGTLLIALYGATIGKLAFLGVDAATNQAVCGIYKNEKVSSKYLYYFLFFNKPKLVEQGVGGAQPNISQRILKNLEMPVPPILIQQTIVSKSEELFSELDKGIEDLKTAQAQLKVYRQSVLKWAFEGRLTNEVVNGELPEEWRTVELKDVCTIRRGKSKHRPRNAVELYGGEYPFIQTGEIRNANGGYIKMYSQTYSEIGLQQSKLWPKGTLCITIAANIGETGILSFDACFPDSVVGILSNQSLLITEYLNYFLVSIKRKLDELAPATAQKNINVEILEKVKINIAPLNEQNQVVQEIESRLSVADKMEESIKESLLKAEALRQSILKKAFRGELV